MFIDASKDFEKNKNQNYLTDSSIKKIFETYKERKEVEKYSHKATLEEIKENDFNLNIPRYVNTFEEPEPIDINKVSLELRELGKKEPNLKEKIDQICEELSIEKPF